MTTCFAIFTLEAAHRLENVPDGHKCKRLHGHTYEVRIEVDGDLDVKLGWIIDYAVIEKVWMEQIHSRLDHHNLNEVLPELRGNTTSERLAVWMRNKIRHALGLLEGQAMGLHQVRVEVWETASCGAMAS